MCELLCIRAHRQHLTDEAFNTVGLWHQGYVVQVMPDGYKWSRKERKSIWLSQGNREADWHGQTQLFLLPGESVDAVFRSGVTYQDLTLGQAENDNGEPLYDFGDGSPSLVDMGAGPWMLRRRIWQISETLPPDVQAELDVKAEYLVNPINRFNSFVKRSNLGVTAPLLRTPTKRQAVTDKVRQRVEEELIKSGPLTPKQKAQERAKVERFIAAFVVPPRII